MQRRTRLTLIVFGVFLFLATSVIVAKALVGSGNERAEVLDVLRAQAAGDAGAVLARLPACRRDATCARLARERTRRLARPGDVEILRFEPSVQVALTNREGSARVVWRTSESRFPVVQCVQVRREGPLSGGDVVLRSISEPIGLEASCR